MKRNYSVNLKELCKLTHRVDCPDEALSILKFGKRPTFVGPKKHGDPFFTVAEGIPFLRTRKECSEDVTGHLRVLLKPPHGVIIPL
jgi:hypothetical protein